MSKQKPLYLILDNIRSLYNVGSIFRSADAFGVDKIFLCGYTAYPPSRQMAKVAKTALGAEASVPWEYCRQTVRLIKNIQSQNFNIVTLENNVGYRQACTLRKYKPKFPLALVVGNETKGISRNILKQADRIISIPMQGMKESLNVAVAAAIALYHLNLKR